MPETATIYGWPWAAHVGITRIGRLLILRKTASSIITYWHKSLLQPIANGMNILHLACRTVPHSLGDPKTVARTHCCLPATSHLAT